MSKQRAVQLAAWGLALLAVVLAVVAWGQSLRWQVWGASTYLLFPIFGLLAFSLLWAQYLTLALRQWTKTKPAALGRYFGVSGWLVLVAILLHPGLLVWQLWRAGGGLPPGSELRYVLPSLRWVVILGTINLTILLLFELRRVFAARWWWKIFGYVVDAAMFSIFYHGLRLGNQLQTGWYRQMWFIYGFTLAVAIAYLYWSRWQCWHTARQSRPAAKSGV